MRTEDWLNLRSGPKRPQLSASTVFLYNQRLIWMINYLQSACNWRSFEVLITSSNNCVRILGSFFFSPLHATIPLMSQATSKVLTVLLSGIWKTLCKEWKEFLHSFFSFFFLFPLFALEVLHTALGPLEFFSLLFFEQWPTITASHKQWGLLIGEAARRESWEGGGECYCVWQLLRWQPLRWGLAMCSLW